MLGSSQFSIDQSNFWFIYQNHNTEYNHTIVNDRRVARKVSTHQMLAIHKQTRETHYRIS